MKQCERGHIFDEKMYASCPYCAQNSGVGIRPLANAGNPAPAFPKTAPLDSGSTPNFPATQPLDPPSAPAPAKKEMSATIAINTTDSGIRPVCGWLVVSAGDSKGRSFNIHSEKNTVGRGAQFDIDLSFDKAVSKEGDAVITYDSRGKKFFITLSAGKNNVYHNGNILLMPEEIKDYDVIEIGATKLVFRSFCNEEYTY